MTEDAQRRLRESLRRVESVGDDLARLRLEAERTKRQVETMAAKALKNREMALRALEEARQTANEVKGHHPGISDVINEKVNNTKKSAKKIGRGRSRRR